MRRNKLDDSASDCISGAHSDSGNGDVGCSHILWECCFCNGNNYRNLKPLNCDGNGSSSRVAYTDKLSPREPVLSKFFKLWSSPLIDKKAAWACCNPRADVCASIYNIWIDVRLGIARGSTIHGGWCWTLSTPRLCCPWCLYIWKPTNGNNWEVADQTGNLPWSLMTISDGKKMTQVGYLSSTSFQARCRVWNSWILCPMGMWSGLWKIKN